MGNKQLKGVLFLALFVLSVSVYGQDTITLLYSRVSRYHVRGFSVDKARRNSMYVIAKDLRGRKRLEGRINPSDGWPYRGVVIRYRKNGTIKYKRDYK